MNVPLNSLSGRRALHLFQRAAEEIEHHLIGLKESSRSVQDDHMMGKEVDQPPQFLVGLPERGLRWVAVAVSACWFALVFHDETPCGWRYWRSKLDAAPRVSPERRG